MAEITLSMLMPGENGKIASISLEGGIRRRLQDLGFVSGTPVSALYDAPSGSPKAFAIRGSVIALRRSDCARIGVLMSHSRTDEKDE